MEEVNDEDVIDELYFSKMNKIQILELGKIKNKTDIQIIRLNILVEEESKSILNEKGQTFRVHSGRKDRRSMKLGFCWVNSSKMMLKGYGYVEGYVIDKRSGKRISHSWNVDSEGKHWDFTYDHPDNYEYFGIIIPEEVVWEVGQKNGGMWFCVLPFIDDPKTLTLT